MKYEYICLNIYSGEYTKLKTNKSYKKHELILGEWAVKECTCNGWCIF